MENQGLEVRTYFVRERNALVARADFSDLYVDYYLHLADLGEKVAEADDEMFKNALAALTLHCASRPWNESVAWTIHFEEPLLNLFVAGDNSTGNVIGCVHRENVKHAGSGIFYSDLVRGTEPVRRSVVDIEGNSVFGAVEAFYARSEQRAARLFPIDGDDVVLVTAQPDCDLDWLESLDIQAVHSLDSTESLSLLEKRIYEWRCGCNQRRMMQVLEAPMRQDAHALFGDEESLRIHCPRCGARHAITREAMEAFIDNNESASGVT